MVLYLIPSIWWFSQRNPFTPIHHTSHIPPAVPHSSWGSMWALLENHLSRLNSLLHYNERFSRQPYTIHNQPVYWFSTCLLRSTCNISFLDQQSNACYTNPSLLCKNTDTCYKHPVDIKDILYLFHQAFYTVCADKTDIIIVLSLI